MHSLDWGWEATAHCCQILQNIPLFRYVEWPLYSLREAILASTHGLLSPDLDKNYLLGWTLVAIPQSSSQLDIDVRWLWYCLPISGESSLAKILVCQFREDGFTLNIWLNVVSLTLMCNSLVCNLARIMLSV